MKSGHSEASPNGRAEQAAQAILALINSRPRSPRTDEIVAIINSLDLTAAAAPSCPHCGTLDREYGPINHQP